MNDILFMHEIQTLTNLQHQVCGLVLAYFSLAIAGHAAIRHAFHDQVYFVLVVEHTVQVRDMAVDQIGLDFDFPKH